MENRRDGGQAFPVRGLWEGMTLRDYFAAAAIAGLAEKPGEGCIEYMQQRARVAYQIADAMIAARKE